MPEEEKATGLCPICDSKVALDAKKCPECKADLSVFGVKTGEDELHDVNLPEYEESLEKLLGEISKKDVGKEHELFEEIMAAVDKTNSLPKEEGAAAEEGVVEASVEETVAEEAPAEGTVMFECPLCKTLVGEDATSCPGCGAIFAESGEEEAAAAAEAPVEEPSAPAETFVEEAVPEETQFIEEPVAEPEVVEEELPPVEEPVEEEEADLEKRKRKFRLSIKRKKEAEAGEPRFVPPPPPDEAPAEVGVKDEKTLHNNLSRAVSEVKPLLADARKIGIDVGDGRRLIDEAIAAGKRREFQRAIALVKDSEKTIESALNLHIIDSIQTTQVKVDALKRAGGNVEDLFTMTAEVRSLLSERKYGDAALIANKLAETAESTMLKLKASLKKKEYMEKEEDVNERLGDLVELIKSGEEVKVNVKKAKALLTQARVAMKRSEWEKARDLLIEAKEDFLRELPKQLTQIIANSKPVLYKAKMQGVNIKASIRLLKEASAALKLNNYLDALETIKRYNMEMKQYME